MLVVRAQRRFEQFGPDHFGALLAIGALAVLLSLLLRRARRRSTDNRTRRVLCWTLALFLGAVWTGEQAYEVTSGLWSLRESLPLHLCDMAVFVSVAALLLARRPDGAVALDHGVHQSETANSATGRVQLFRHVLGVRPRQLLVELAYFWGLGGTVQALLTPELAYVFPHPIYFTFFANHGGVVATVLVLVLGLGVRPQRGFVWRVFAATNFLAVPVALFDWLADANYMYLCGPPKNPSLYDYCGRWPWSLLTLEAVGLLLLLLFYAPFRFGRRLGCARGAD